MLLELFAIFFMVPLAVWKQWLPVPLIMIPLYLLAGYAAVWMFADKGGDRRQFWSGGDVLLEKAYLKIILRRLVLVVTLVWLVVYAFYPDKLFLLPREHPLIWLLILLLYPALSVYPQELLYRAFFFSRYAGLFTDKYFMIMASTVFFAFMHVVFGNPVAILSTLIGGYLFADTYSRTRSLRLVCLEHALYGSVIFTLGLGEFFVFGAAKTFLM